MYVIFPADEVVCQSYGRVIYIPSNPFNRVTTPIRTSLSTGSSTSYPSVPSTCSSSTKSRHSTVSEPVFANTNSSNCNNITTDTIKSSPSSKSLYCHTSLPPVRPQHNRTDNKTKFLKVPLNYSFNNNKERGKSSSPIKNCQQAVHLDFESFRKRDISPGNFSFRSCSPSNLKSDKVSARDKKNIFGSIRRKKIFDQKMAMNESALKDLIHPGYNEHLKSHNAVTFKLVRTVSDFTQQLGQMYEQHSQELQMLVSNFRKKNGELRKERPACPSSLFHTWETLLQEVEIDSQALGDIASILGRQVSRPMLERSFFRKIQSRKVFTHRESYETIIAKTEEKLVKCRQEYKNAYLSYLATPSTETLSAYFNTHNAYIQQLHATNGMLDEYGKETLPLLLQELEDIYADLCATVSEGILQGAEVVSTRAQEQSRRYETLISQCKSLSSNSDLLHLAKSLPFPTTRAPILKRLFVPPQPPVPVEDDTGETKKFQENIPPPLKDELVIDRLSAVQVKPTHDVLQKEALDLQSQIRQIQDALETLVRIQQRSVEAALYNKANELQEDISMKRFDLSVAQIHLSAINSQKELFSSKFEGEPGSTRERKMSAASTASMKNKWLKAFKSLKTPPPESEKKNGSAATRELLKGDPDAHNFQEYTYKKITPCDICSQILRGHTRQGLRCRICKMNVHADCQDKASKCQTKARLLRRQKSTSEIETRIPETPMDDETPSSPVHNRRLLSAKNIRMSSVELPDDNDKSPSSASTSPCPSPVGAKKSHRLLPTNLYVVLYNFKSRHQDELDLKAGYKVTVIDTSDADWWKGKCLGRVGFFPSKYVSKLSPGEKPLQVTHNLQVSDGDNGLMLLRDQIVIQIGEELDGMVMIRSGDNRQGVCPVKFLQEV